MFIVCALIGKNVPKKKVFEVGLIGSVQIFFLTSQRKEEACSSSIILNILEVIFYLVQRLGFQTFCT